jgi:Ser/Thr protein kinase RdoA (MazF antagonist)
MDQQALEQVCRLYSLGAPIAPAEQVFGGLRHQMYRMRTQRGEFALKLLGSEALTEPNTRVQIKRGERIAAAVAAAGLPAVAALEADGEVLHPIGNHTVLVHPWINGSLLASDTTAPHPAERIGKILARIHQLSLQFPEPLPSQEAGFSEDTWTRLVQESEGLGWDGACELRAVLPDLARWTGILTDAQRALGKQWVVSHADLHQQNVLWSDERTPWLIDWESAGLQQPAKEAVVCALEWSGFVEGEPDLTLFRAFLQGYRQEAPLAAGEVPVGLRACFGNWLGWLLFCAQRALHARDADERAQGAAQVLGTLTTIRRVEASFPQLEEVGKG